MTLEQQSIQTQAMALLAQRLRGAAGQAEEMLLEMVEARAMSASKGMTPYQLAEYSYRGRQVLDNSEPGSCGCCPLATHTKQVLDECSYIHTAAMERYCKVAAAQELGVLDAMLRELRR